MTADAPPRAAVTGAALAVLYLFLALPNHPDALTSAAWIRIPLELPVLAILLMLARGRTARGLRWASTLLLTLMAMVKLADLAGYMAFLRPVNPALDWPLAISAWQLASGTVGTPLALAALLLVVGALVLLGFACWWATGVLARIAPASRQRLGLWLALAPALTAAGLGWREPHPLADSATSRLAWQHVADAVAARADLARFRLAAAEDPRAARPALGALHGHDVFLIFVESYGRTALDNPLYGPGSAAVLRAGAVELAARGLVARSAFLTAPMVGGQSWLAHGTLLSGLRLDTEGRYRALLASPRKTLLRLAQAAGWQTAAVMPAITRPWPESGYFGYDRVLTARDLGYRGRPFNWITMPDQFTLAALERQLLPPDHPPTFVETALISSHAPWIPIPPLLPWESLGDGTVFDPYAAGDETPEALWRNPDRVREHYGEAVAYSLATVLGFAGRRADSAPLLIVLGDHQPAAFVSQQPENRDVPVHLIGTPDQIARIGAWGWTDGLLPASDAPVWPMEAFRDRFLDAFSG